MNSSVATNCLMLWLQSPDARWAFERTNLPARVASGGFYASIVPRH
jgi:hypothetical protein